MQEGDSPEAVHLMVIRSRVVANTILSKGALRGSALIDSFSGWLLAGFAAAAAFLIANLDEASTHVPAAQARFVMTLFVWSLLAAVVQRYLAVLVAAWASGEADGRTVFAETGIAPSDIDPDVMFDEAVKAYWWPARVLVIRMARRIKDGDFALAGRVALRAAQLQGLALLLQIILSLVAASSIAWSLAEYGADASNPRPTETRLPSSAREAGAGDSPENPTKLELEKGR